MENEQKQFQNRIRELEETSWQESRYLFTGFLNEAEYADVLALGSPACGMKPFGGFEGAARVMIRFGDPEVLGYEEPFPITILCVTPLMDKFADALTHRDFLGAILNLGIERRVIGDILVDSPTAYVMCESQIAGFIADNLTRVRHTAVRAAITASLPDQVRPRLASQEIQVSSNRIDAVIAQVYHLSRSGSQELMAGKQVYINGRTVENSSRELHEGDEVSVRHQGKFRYQGTVRKTRKGKLCVLIERYI